jgi:hypothetical protein
MSFNNNPPNHFTYSYTYNPGGPTQMVSGLLETIFDYDKSNIGTRRLQKCIGND